MKRFIPHDFKPGMALLRPMKINVIISQNAYDKMYYLAKHNENEVGWLGTVERKGYEFFLHDIYVYEQEVNGATTEISVDGITKVTMALLQQPNGVALVNSLRMWGHK